jgi:hypothetical protein
MKKTLLIAAVLFFSSLSFAQFNFAKYDKESFLIGTLDDYMGHQQTFINSGDGFYFQMVDIFFQGEMKKAQLIDSLFRNENPDLRLENNGASKGIKLYSATLSKKINRYYNYKPTGSYTIFHDTIYTGNLNRELITTDEQKLSFLAGCFFRTGLEAGANEFVMNIPNSASKAKLCAEFLKELGCKNVEYKIRTGYIPVGHSVIFEPSKKIRQVIEEVQFLDRKSS